MHKKPERYCIRKDRSTYFHVFIKLKMQNNQNVSLCSDTKSNFVIEEQQVVDIISILPVNEAVY